MRSDEQSRLKLLPATRAAVSELRLLGCRGFCFTAKERICKRLAREWPASLVTRTANSKVGSVPASSQRSYQCVVPDTTDGGTVGSWSAQRVSSGSLPDTPIKHTRMRPRSPRGAPCALRAEVVRRVALSDRRARARGFRLKTLASAIPHLGYQYGGWCGLRCHRQTPRRYFAFRFGQNSIGACKDRLPLPVFRVAYLSGTLFTPFCFRQILSRFCFHCSLCPFPNGPHQGGVISKYSKVDSPTCGYPINCRLWERPALKVTDPNQ